MTSPVSGLGIAASALRSAERKMEVVANNLANTSTDGFKAERTFARLLGEAQGAPVLFTKADVSQGAVRDTGEPLDLALDGPGFVVIATPRGERWVRGGTLTIDPANRLTQGGAPLLGEKGVITLPARYDELSIQPDGDVFVDGRKLDRLRVERPTDAAAPLDREPQGTFIPGADRRVAEVGERKLRQGALEGSNVEPVSTMVEMLGIQRHHALLERAIRVLDETRETAATQLGKPV
ncbi:MAG: flagellar hook basal-body protein [Gemmatimonadales bacterium]|nr:flagellar hook basal-body protein [Gemmatimonadales bacterium]